MSDEIPEEAAGHYAFGVVDIRLMDSREAPNAPAEGQVYNLVKIDEKNLCIWAHGAALQSGYLTNTQKNAQVGSRAQSTWDRLGDNWLGRAKVISLSNPHAYGAGNCAYHAKAYVWFEAKAEKKEKKEDKEDNKKESKEGGVKK